MKRHNHLFCFISYGYPFSRHQRDDSCYKKTMNGYRLTSDYTPRGDQPRAIAELVEGVERGDLNQVLLGVTG